MKGCHQPNSAWIQPNSQGISWGWQLGQARWVQTWVEEEGDWFGEKKEILSSKHIKLGRAKPTPLRLQSVLIHWWACYTNSKGFVSTLALGSLVKVPGLRLYLAFPLLLVFIIYIYFFLIALEFTTLVGKTESGVASSLEQEQHLQLFS